MKHLLEAELSENTSVLSEAQQRKWHFTDTSILNGE